MLFYGTLIKIHGKHFIIILCTILFGLTPALFKNSQFGNADIPLAFYTTLGILFIHLWTNREKEPYLFFGVISLGLAGWTKNEGQSIWIVATIIILLFLIKKEKKLRIIPIILLTSLIWLPWFAYVQHHHLSTEQWLKNIDLPFIINNSSRILIITRSFLSEMLDVTIWGQIWIFFFISTIVHFFKKF